MNNDDEKMITFCPWISWFPVCEAKVRQREKGRGSQDFWLQDQHCRKSRFKHQLIWLDFDNDADLKV